MLAVVRSLCEAVIIGLEQPVEFRTVVDSSGGLRERVEQGVGDFRGEPCVSRYGCNSLLPQGSA